MISTEDVVLLEAEGVRAEVDPTGPRLRSLVFGGADYLAAGTASGARLFGAPDADAPLAELVPERTRWRVVDHTAGTLTLGARTDTAPIAPVTAVSVGSFGLVVVHGLTNTAAHPLAAGVRARVHPFAGETPVLGLCGEPPEAADDLVGADSAELPGRPVREAGLQLAIGGGRPLPGKTHVVHRLRSGADRSGDGVRIWGEAEFAWTGARIADGSVELELRTLPGDGGAAGRCVLEPGQTRMLCWGLQPFALRGPLS
ncbi:hypothetical protein [Sciscionella sediminilitoris]|uniref:hypothetical protein n=1 Tax=Sciscionella sediminilitoris TaxID=1445613 RepID=UPI0004DFB40B|nr:hypothetical protein [Sciscionella sp. SE31]